LLQEIGQGASSLDWAIVKLDDPEVLKPVDPLVHVKIAAYLVGLRAVLDYTAQEIVERYKLQPKDPRRVQFPMGDRGEEKFRKAMKEMFPGLEDRQPDVYEALRALQSFSGNEYAWALPKLRELVNENKHLRLSRTDLTFQGTRVIKEGDEVRVQKFASEPSRPDNAIIARSALVFEGTHVQVVPLLENCKKQVVGVLSALQPFGLP